VVQKAYVLIKVGVGKATTVGRALQKLPGVREVDLVMGPDDIIATLEQDNSESIARIVLNEIAAVDGVERTSTYLVVALDKEGE